MVATGVQYDAAGNMINDGTQAYSYDEANRLKTAGNYYYTYSGLENKRVIAYDNTHPTTPGATINLYGPDGKRLGYYRFGGANSGWTTTTPGPFQNFLYLGNKALSYTEDRIGSTGNYFPYGNGYNLTGAEGQAFGTYVQDESGLLYADQRHYNPNFGRFMTADRSNANIDYGNPTSWNRYAYTNGDPVNGMDPNGLACITLDDGNVADDLTGGGCSGADTTYLYNFDYDLSAPPVEPCSLAENIDLTCPGGVGQASAAGISRRFPWVGVGWWGMARFLGNWFENQVSDVLGLAKNTQFILNGTVSGSSRIPDFVDQANKIIYEAKNVSAQTYSSQINDMTQWAEQNGYTFELYVREGAYISPSLQRAVQNGLLTINELPFP